MYSLYGILIGIIISLMVSVNGLLTNATGLYLSSVIIHIVGLVTMIIICSIKKIKLFDRRYAYFMYLGGVFGVFATLGNNYAFSYLGVSGILALGLIGQSIMSIIVDHFGLFNLEKYPLKANKFISISIMLIGTTLMVERFDMLAMILSILVGVCLVSQRIVNSELASKTNIIVSTTFTYITGFIGSLIVLLILGHSELSNPSFNIPTNAIYYLGGLLGILTILLSTICVKKLPSFKLSILMFIGQLFSGLLIDSILMESFSMNILIGGIIVTLGLIIDNYLTKKYI